MYWTNQTDIPGYDAPLRVSDVDGYLYSSCPEGYVLHALGTTVYNGITAVRFDRQVSRPVPNTPTVAPANPEDAMIGRIATAAMAVERGADPVAAVAAEETADDEVIENGEPEPRSGLFDNADTYLTTNKQCETMFYGDNAFASSNDRDEFNDTLKETLGLALPSDTQIVFTYHGGRSPGVSMEGLPSSVRSRKIFGIFYLCAIDQIRNQGEDLGVNLYPWGGGPVSMLIKTENEGLHAFKWLGKTMITCHENCIYIHYPMIARMTDSRYHAIKTVLGMVARFYNNGYDKAYEKYAQSLKPKLVDDLERIYKDYLSVGAFTEMQNLHRDIATLREQAEGALSQYLSRLREADRKSLILEALQAKGSTTTPRQEVENQVERIMRIKGLESIKVKRDTISFSTAPIIVAIDPRTEKTVRYKTVRFYLIGRVMVRVNIASGAISFSSLTDKSTWNNYTKNHAAVHVFPDGHACFGNSQNTITTMLKARDLVGLIGTLINFLGTANPDDGLGREFKKWPCVSSLTYKNATPEKIQEVKEQCSLKYSR